MIKELNHIGIRTADIDKSIDFYVNTLGGKIIRDVLSTNGESRFVYIQIVDGIIELISATPDVEDLGLVHIAYIIDNDTTLDECYKKLVKMGYEFTVKPKIAGSGDGRLAFFRDSSNCIFELIERKSDIRLPTVSNTFIEEFDHLSIRINDKCVDKCEDFYLNTMGFKVRKILRKEANVMSYYSHGKDTLETLYTPGVMPNSALQHIAFRVKDTFKMKEYLKSKSIDCPKKIKESQMGGFHILNVIGPDGVAIEFLDRCSLDEYNA